MTSPFKNTDTCSQTSLPKSRTAQGISRSEFAASANVALRFALHGSLHAGSDSLKNHYLKHYVTYSRRTQTLECACQQFESHRFGGVQKDGYVGFWSGACIETTSHGFDHHVPRSAQQVIASVPRQLDEGSSFCSVVRQSCFHFDEGQRGSRLCVLVRVTESNVKRMTGVAVTHCTHSSTNTTNVEG